MNIPGIFKYTLAAIAALLIVSCNDESDPTQRNGQDTAIRFTTNLSNNWATRAGDTSWTTGDVVGIVAVLAGSNLTADATYHQYTVLQGGTSVDLTPTATEQTLYFPTDDSDVKFIAFYPYKEPNASNEVTYTGFDDQTTQEKMEAVNILYHLGGSKYYNQSSTDAVELDFKHKMSQLNINLTTVASSTAAIDLLDVTGVSVSKVPASATITLGGQLQEASDETITTNMFLTPGATTATAQAIVVEHTGISYPDRTITVNMAGGDSYTYTLHSNLNFEIGKKYTLDLELTTNGLRMIGENSADWLDDFTQWNSQTTLSVPETEVVLDWEAIDKYDMSFKTNSNIISVKYSSSATDPEATIPGDWITANGTTGLGTGGEGYYKYEYSFALTENAGAGRTGYIHITADNLTQVVKVKQKGLPNSYIVKAGETVELPVARANAFTQSIGESDAITDATTFTGEVLWMDAQGLIDAADLTALEIEGTGAAAKLKVKAATGKTGNAIVAVKVGSEVVWSWQIWVTDYAPDPVTDTWMDRNLGAIDATPGANGSIGLYYQWGRKDPFPGSATTTSKSEPTIYTPTNTIGTTYSINTDGSQHSISWTVANPETFIAAGNGSWMEGSTNNDTNWNTVENEKTLFDPCPAGYRVPFDDAWSTLTTDNFPWDATHLGRDAGSTYGGWYPAAGYRHGNDGIIDALGFQSYGNYWSNYSTGSANRLYFYSTLVNTRSAHAHTFGNSVRCVAE